MARFRKRKVVNMLVSADDVRDQRIYFKDDRENIVKRMDGSAKLEAVGIIRDRYESAREQTEWIREKMYQWDLQYKGHFTDDEGEVDERIFLPKTREEINIVRAFLISMVAQLNPIVTVEPMVSVVWAAKDEWERSKVAEALLQFYFSDVWKIIDDVLPRFLTHMLKYSMGCYKVSYVETDYNPDLLLDIVDRAFLYIDPTVNRTEEARWMIEEYYIPRSEVVERAERGDWIIPDNQKEFVRSVTSTGISDVNLQRYFGENLDANVSVEVDELVQCFDYWQYPRQGLGDLYATIVGGIDGVLARYGRNPYPYKGNQFVSASFNPDDRPDGQGMAELQEPFQVVLNTFLNLRLTDVRKNIQRAAIVPDQMIDKQTQQDFENGNSIVRAAPEFLEAIIAQGGDIKKFIGEFPGGTSTQELFTDLQFMLGQGRESSNISEVFQGLNPQAGATLGQIQEQLTRNAGSFRPVMRQVMRAFERLADICMHYFKDPEFFPEDRIIRVVGENKYENTVKEWHRVGDNTHIRNVSSDEMADLDVTFNAVQGSDALTARTLLSTTIERMFQSIGQIPELFEELRQNIDFSALFKQLLMTSGHDVNALLMSPEQQKEKQARDQQKQQQALQAQAQQQQIQIDLKKQLSQIDGQVQMLVDQNKQQSRAQSQIAIDNEKVGGEIIVNDQKSDQDSENKIREIVTEITAQLTADLTRDNNELRNEIKRMNREGQIEASNAKITNVSKAGGGNIQQGQGDGT